MERLVETLARALVQDAGAVRVSRFDRGDSLVMELEVSPADRGRLIGRNGQTISALRTLGNREALIAAWPELRVLTTEGVLHRDILGVPDVVQAIVEFIR